MARYCNVSRALTALEHCFKVRLDMFKSMQRYNNVFKNRAAFVVEDVRLSLIDSIFSLALLRVTLDLRVHILP